MSFRFVIGNRWNLELVAMSAATRILKRLIQSHSWRVPATGLGFALFGLGGTICSFSVFPLLYFLPLNINKKEKITRAFISWVFRNYVRILRGLGLISYEFHKTRLLRQSGQLIIANHPSLLDVVFLMGLCNANCVVKNTLWRNPFTAMAVRAANYISNDDPNIFQRCLDSLTRGNSLIIFPEGTRSAPGQSLNFHRGPSNVALSSGVPITPVVILCEPAALLKNKKWYQISAEAPHFSFYVMPRIDVTQYRNDEQMQSKAARNLTRDLKEYFQQQINLRLLECSVKK
jgi:1-acyl-sn-glycerol-3-phosphate acyltransferase